MESKTNRSEQSEVFDLEKQSSANPKRLETHWDEYHEWLCEQVVDSEHEHYSRLLDQLDSIWFYSILANDDNRAADGVDLRYSFCDDMDYAYELVDDELNDPCTVLEMLVALAKRCENQLMWDPDLGDRTHVWFWKFIDNLGLGHESDDHWDEEWEEESSEKIDYYVDKLLRRDYFRDGFGGLFPLKHPKKDQRKVEIWYQLQDWLMENYKF